MKSHSISLLLTAALAFSEVTAIAHPALEARRAKAKQCRAVTMTKTTIKTYINRSVTTVCDGVATKSAKADTTSEVVKTEAKGVCHYYVAMSGGKPLSTVSAWCVDKPATAPTPSPTDAAAGLSTTEIVSTQTNGVCHYYVVMSDGAPVSTASAWCVDKPATAPIPSPTDAAAGLSTTEIVSTQTNGVCHYYVVMSDGAPVSTASAWCVDKPATAPTPSPTDAAAGVSTTEIVSTQANGGVCHYYVVMSDEVPVATASGWCVL